MLLLVVIAIVDALNIGAAGPAGNSRGRTGIKSLFTMLSEWAVGCTCVC